jgi:hypothetical protein
MRSAELTGTPLAWTIIPITWRNRRTGEPKLEIKSRYLFICLYVGWKSFSAGATTQGPYPFRTKF